MAMFVECYWAGRGLRLSSWTRLSCRFTNSRALIKAIGGCYAASLACFHLPAFSSPRAKAGFLKGEPWVVRLAAAQLLCKPTPASVRVSDPRSSRWLGPSSLSRWFRWDKDQACWKQRHPPPSVALQDHIQEALQNPRNSRSLCARVNVHRQN